MVADPGQPSEWAFERFGEYAADLWKLVPEAIKAGVGRQIDTHVASGLASLHAYGGAWPALHEELVNHVGGLEGVHMVRPAGSAVHYVVVNGSLLVPFRYARDLHTPLNDPSVTQRLNKTCRSLLSQLGPQPRPVSEQLPLSDDFLPQPADPLSSSKLLSDPCPENITLIAFASNTAALLAIAWGEAALLGDDTLQWVYQEELPMPPNGQAGPAMQPMGPTGPWPMRPTGGPGRRFDDHPLDGLTVSSRPKADQSTTEPLSESQPLSAEPADGADNVGQ
jgi:hypothetical protein